MARWDGVEWYWEKGKQGPGRSGDKQASEQAGKHGQERGSVKRSEYRTVRLLFEIVLEDERVMKFWSVGMFRLFRELDPLSLIYPGIRPASSVIISCNKLSLSSFFPLNDGRHPVLATPFTFLCTVAGRKRWILCYKFFLSTFVT